MKYTIEREYDYDSRGRRIPWGWGIYPPRIYPRDLYMKPLQWFRTKREAVAWIDGAS